VYTGADGASHEHDTLLMLQADFCFYALAVKNNITNVFPIIPFNVVNFSMHLTMTYDCTTGEISRLNVDVDALAQFGTIGEKIECNLHTNGSYVIYGAYQNDNFGCHN
jgi:hypothetical protein